MIPTYTEDELAAIFPHSAPERQQELLWRYQLEYTRIERLTDEFEKLDGFIYMRDWMRGVSSDNLEAARANPCGTAACIAGKAGIMEVFREEGFEWGMNGFSIAPEIFFGRLVYYSIFVGTWTQENIHTTQHAVLVLRAFLDWFTLRRWAQDVNWWPDEQLRDIVVASRPPVKVFPVSGFQHLSTDEGGMVRDPGWRHVALTIKTPTE